jgi:hypothetical protein
MTFKSREILNAQLYLGHITQKGKQTTAIYQLKYMLYTRWNHGVCTKVNLLR